MDEVEVTVIGAGVVGLAIAAELSRLRRSVVVLERDDAYGRGTSSRNSGVIHSGLYYPEGTLKARLCREGAGLLYALCGSGSIPCRRTGKLVVAADAHELARLDALCETGRRNGLEDLRVLDAKAVRDWEPAVRAEAALHVPDTGIVDVHALMDRLHHEAAAGQALFSFSSEVDRIERVHAGFILQVRQENYRFLSRIVINSAGLAADRIAALAGLDIDRLGYRLRYCKGSYFSYSRRSPVSMLVYPLPHEGLTGLGVHATIDLGGRLRFGPDVEYTDDLSYRVDPAKRDLFFDGASRIISGLDREAFQPEMAGIRPKLQGPGEPVRDFVIADEAANGLPGLIDLIGIESPGLTAAPAIARMVGGMVETMLG